VNVITFSGHGFTFGRDSIAVIPDHYKNERGELCPTLRFINMSAWARKFAWIRHCLTVFILSMCRVFIPEDIELRIKGGEEVSATWKNLKQDAIALSKHELCEGTCMSEGYSVMLFSSSIHYPIVDGLLREEFFKRYLEYEITSRENIGWKLLESFKEDYK
jgi:hypothetical protein